MLDEPVVIGFVEACECGGDGEAAFVGGFAIELDLEYFAEFVSGIVAGNELIDGEWNGSAANISEGSDLLLHFAGALPAVGEIQEAGDKQNDDEDCGDAGEVSAAGCCEHLPFEGGAILVECEDADAQPVCEWREVPRFAAVSPEGGEFSEEYFGAAAAGFALFAVYPGSDGWYKVVVGQLPCWFGVSRFHGCDKFEITVEDLQDCLEVGRPLLVAGGEEKFGAAAAASADAEACWWKQEFEDFAGGGCVQSSLWAGGTGVEGFFKEFDTEPFEAAEIGEGLGRPVAMAQHFGEEGKSNGDDATIDGECICGLAEELVMFAGPVCGGWQTIPCLSEACEDGTGVGHIEEVNKSSVEAFKHGDFDGIHEPSDGDGEVIANEEQGLEV